ncbi:hypothetical protein [Paenibacillus agaridevorans]|uniref:hypothetical protein n=1 Tax=Paenibacillus agaridevorans TaxID=171404 RepID=UPI001BE3EA22|nr:hypothetical protein [Paenibacillus agaridevorans]
MADGEDAAFIEQLIEYWTQRDRGIASLTTEVWRQDKVGESQKEVLKGIGSSITGRKNKDLKKIKE